MPWEGCCTGKGLNRHQQSLPKEEKEDRDEKEKGVLEDQPGKEQVLTLTGHDVHQDAAAKRHCDQQPEDAEYEHLGGLSHQSEPGDARRGLFGAFEACHFPRSRVGHECPQQLVVQRMAGLVRRERAEQWTAKQV